MSLNRYEWLMRTITFHDHSTVRTDFLDDSLGYTRLFLTEFQNNARKYDHHAEFVAID